MRDLGRSNPAPSPLDHVDEHGHPDLSFLGDLVGNQPADDDLFKPRCQGEIIGLLPELLAHEGVKDDLGLGAKTKGVEDFDDALAIGNGDAGAIGSVVDVGARRSASDEVLGGSPGICMIGSLVRNGSDAGGSQADPGNGPTTWAGPCSWEVRCEDPRFQ